MTEPTTTTTTSTTHERIDGVLTTTTHIKIVTVHPRRVYHTCGDEPGECYDFTTTPLAALNEGEEEYSPTSPNPDPVPEDECEYRPTSPSYSPTSPTYGYYGEEDAEQEEAAQVAKTFKSKLHVRKSAPIGVASAAADAVFVTKRQRKQY